MEKGRPSFQHCQVPLIALVALLMLVAPACAQEGAKIEVVPALGHSGPVVSVAFSANGARVLSGSRDQTIKLWDAETGALIRTFKGHSDIVESVAFSPNGARVLSGSRDQTIKLWDAETGALIRTFEWHSAQVSSVAFSPDGARVLSGSRDQTMKLWDTATGALIRTFKGHSGSVYSVVFSPEGSRVLSGSNDNTIKLWDAATGELIRTLGVYHGPPPLTAPLSAPVSTKVPHAKTAPTHSDAVTSVAFSPDGARVLSGSDDSTIKLWDAATGTLIRTFEGHYGEVSSVAFSPDGVRVLTSGHDATIRLWNAATGALLRTFKGHTGWVYSVAFSRDGARVLSGGDDGTIKLWDAVTDALIRTFEGHSGWVSSVAFSPADARVLSGSSGQEPFVKDTTIKLWNAATGALIRTFVGHSGVVNSVAFSPDGAHVVSGSRDSRIKLWDVETGALIRTFKGRYGEVTSPINSVAFSPDGARVVSGDARIKLWDPATGTLVRAFEYRSGNPVTSVTFSPDGARVLSGDGGAITGFNENIELWDAATGALIRAFGELSGPTWVAFSPDGARVLSGGERYPLTPPAGIVSASPSFARNVPSGGGPSDELNKNRADMRASPARSTPSSSSGENTIKLWNAATGALIRIFEGHSNAVTSVTFSPDGARVLSGSRDNTIKLWDAATGALIRTFEGHSSAVTSVAFSPHDGSRVLSGSADGTVGIWNTASGERLASLMGTRNGEWLSITPSGFFAASGNSTQLLSIVRRFEVTAIDQVWQSLFNPDLVRLTLGDDPDGEVRDAAKVINLDQVLDSGPAPVVAITSPPPRSQSAADFITAQARITDKGKGVGRIEWRVNGVTVGVANAPEGVGDVYDVKQNLALDISENRIEVVAYNKINLLASLPAETTITFTGRADTLKSKLHVLAIGINQYVDYRGWITPEGKPTRFGPLRLAVNDAVAIGDELKKAGTGIYSGVRVKTMLDREATVAGLDAAVNEMAAEIHPRDTFVFFAAGHGYSHQGRFYLIPQDYQGGTNPEALTKLAIDQARLQDWIANRIKAKKALILLDTCESGALTSGYRRSRVDDPSADASIGRLHEATGRPVLTAAAQGQEALEFRGIQHGIFTSALIDALHHSETNKDGVIMLSALVAHVQDLVPKLVKDPKEREALLRRGEPGGVQSARFGSRGDDFPFARRLQ